MQFPRSAFVGVVSGFFGAALALLILRPSSSVNAEPVVQASKVVDASELVLWDSKGRQRARLYVDLRQDGEPVIFDFLDIEGTSLGRLRYGARGSAVSVTFKDSVASMMATKGHSFVQANGYDGGASLHATADPKGEPYVSVGGHDGTYRQMTVKGIQEVKEQ